MLAGVLLAAAAGLCLKHASPPDDALFLLEMPPYRVPSMRTVLRGALRHTLDFLRRVSTVILLAAILTWLARSFTWSLRPADSFQFSMLGAISGTSAKLLSPLGFGSPEAAAALIAGLSAKENIISTLAILTSGELRSVFASPAEAMSFLAFVMLYSPCAAALAAISREAGARTAIRVAISQTLLAWAAAFLLRNVLVLIV